MNGLWDIEFSNLNTSPDVARAKVWPPPPQEVEIWHMEKPERTQQFNQRHFLSPGDCTT